MLWVGIALVVVLAVGGFYLLYRRIRKRESRLLSFFALQREPMTLDPAVLAHLAAKAWNVDVGDGSAEGADGFVAVTGPINMIVCDDRMYLLNSFPGPYVENPDQAAAEISDLRIRDLFAKHKAWLSCDAMGVDASTPEAEVLDWYRRLGKLFAELIDDNCLLIFVPDLERGFPVNEDTEAALRSANPIQELQETLTAPIIQISDDDPLMKKAVAQAQQEWPKFVAAFEAKDGENFAVKAPVTAGGNTEFIWVTVTAIEGDRIFGTLGNDPVNLGKLQLGSKVSLPLKQLNDWIYIDSKEELVGGFTIEAVKKAARRASK